MDTYRRSGIVTGILFLLADAAGFLSCLGLRFINAPDYLSRIPANEQAVLAAALLVFIMGWADAGIGISMFPVLRRHNEGLALGAAGFRIIDGVFHGISAVLILMLVTLGRQFVAGSAVDPAGFPALGAVLREGRDWTGTVAALPAWCIGACMYYALFYKTRLVPRWLSVWGLLGIALTIAGSILVLFGRVANLSPVQVLLYLPCLVQELVLAGWLITRGFSRTTAGTPQPRNA
jgi:hypothetical protein